MTSHFKYDQLCVLRPLNEGIGSISLSFPLEDHSWNFLHWSVASHDKMLCDWCIWGFQQQESLVLCLVTKVLWVQCYSYRCQGKKPIDFNGCRMTRNALVTNSLYESSWWEGLCILELYTCMRVLLSNKKKAAQLARQIKLKRQGLMFWVKVHSPPFVPVRWHIRDRAGVTGSYTSLPRAQGQIGASKRSSLSLVHSSILQLVGAGAG